jgi:hypothetical protein
MKRKANVIRAELMLRGHNIRTVANQLGVSHTLVSRTIRGEINNRKVLRALVSLGVPQRLLALPNDMQPRKAA